MLNDAVNQCSVFEYRAFAHLEGRVRSSQINALRPEYLLDPYNRINVMCIQDQTRGNKMQHKIEVNNYELQIILTALDELLKKYQEDQAMRYTSICVNDLINKLEKIPE